MALYSFPRVRLLTELLDSRIQPNLQFLSSFSRFFCSQPIVTQKPTKKTRNPHYMNDLQTVREVLRTAKQKEIILDENSYSRAMFVLRNNNLHKEMENVYKEMCINGFRQHFGARMNLIRSYMSRDMIQESLNLLYEMEVDKKSNRAFCYVFQTMVEKGLIFKAFELLHKRDLKDISLNMLVPTFTLIINSCYQQPEHKLVYRLIKIFEDFQIEWRPDLITALQKWSEFKKKPWHWEYSKLKDGKCFKCGQSMRAWVPPENFFEDVENEILNFFSNRMSPGLHRTKKIVQERGVFDVIIDTESVLMIGKEFGMHEKKYLEKKLEFMVRHFSEQGKRIFLPLVQSRIMKNNISVKFLNEFLRAHCEVLVYGAHDYDDYLIIYATVLSGLNRTDLRVLTNDKWKNHCNVISTKYGQKLAIWCEMNHINFFPAQVDNKNWYKFDFNVNEYNKFYTMQRDDFYLHIPFAKHGVVVCVNTHGDLKDH